MALLREVFEGTPLYRTRPDGSPFRTEVRTVARMNTEACTILEPRHGLPPELAHRMWCCMSTSLSGMFVPFHLGVASIEPHYATAEGRYDPASAYWLFTELAKLVDFRYRACAEVVRSRWASFEAETLATLTAVEDRLAGAGPSGGRRGPHGVRRAAGGRCDPGSSGAAGRSEDAGLLRGLLMQTSQPIPTGSRSATVASPRWGTSARWWSSSSCASCSPC